MAELIYVNGEVIPSGQARVSALDRGWLFGDALFETMRAYAGRVFRLRHHVERLAASADALQIRLPHTLPELDQIVIGVLQQSEIAEACVRLTLSRGTGISGLGLQGGTPKLMVWVRAFQPHPAELYARGMRLILSRQRTSSASPLPRHKTANYLPYLLAREEARQAGADEAILLNERGEVTEAATANLFIVCNGEVLTPPVSCGLLPGITRAAVMELCAAESILCRQRILRLGDLLAADEVLLTNSLMEVMPVVAVCLRKIGKRRPGPACRPAGRPVTAQIARMYQELVRRECAA